MIVIKRSVYWRLWYEYTSNSVNVIIVALAYTFTALFRLMWVYFIVGGIVNAPMERVPRIIQNHTDRVLRINAHHAQNNNGIINVSYCFSISAHNFVLMHFHGLRPIFLNSAPLKTYKKKERVCEVKVFTKAFRLSLMEIQNDSHCKYFIDIWSER